MFGRGIRSAEGRSKLGADLCFSGIKGETLGTWIPVIRCYRELLRRKAFGYAQNDRYL